MQLDNTRLTIRERSLAEVLDLALHVIREFFQAWMGTSLLAIVPLALINFGLIGWMAASPYVSYADGDFPLRFVWNMTLLVILESPLAGVFTVAYLGPAVFMEEKPIRQVILDACKKAHQIVWCQLVLRGILPAWLLLVMVNLWYRMEFNPFIEGFLLPALVGYSALFRALRPFVNEIILLERLPLRSANPAEMTLAKRSSYLQGPHSADLVARFMLASLTAVFVAWALCYSSLLVLKFLFDFGDLTLVDLLVDVFENQDVSWHQVQFAYPLLLWLVAAYFSVVRFLAYLDLRIKHEGWEVELLMRAEGLRLAGKTW